MRISDWSSDVCSSDLKARRRARPRGYSAVVFAGMAARRYCPSAAPTGKEASAVQAILDRLGRAEAQLLRGRDLDRGAGRRIAAFAGCRFLDLELAEAVDRHFIALGGSIGDHGEDGVNSLLDRKSTRLNSSH